MTTWNHNAEGGGRTYVTFNDREYVSRGEVSKEPTGDKITPVYNSHDQRTKLDLTEINGWLDRVEQLPDE